MVWDLIGTPSAKNVLMIFKVILSHWETIQRKRKRKFFQ